jgi:glycosyltransferase involved in cell wall biosynthesis
VYSKLSIVVPVYNEINTIQEILRQVSDVKIPLEKEIILVDDCSTDGTRDVLEKINNQEKGALDLIRPKGPQSIKVVFHEQNTGKGGALRTGFGYVTGDITIVQDADLEYDPRDYSRLIEPILNGKADVVYGSRFLGRSRPKGILFSSFVANRILTFISNILTGLSLTDMETCYKVMKTSVLKEIELTSDRFGIEPEITAKLAKKRVKIIELPISYLGRDHSTGKKINWKDGLSAIYHILRFNFRK